MLALRQLRRVGCISRLAYLANASPVASSALSSPVEALANSSACGEAASQSLRTPWSLEQVAWMAKASKQQKGGKKGAVAPPAAAAADGGAAAFDLAVTKQLMDKAIDYLQHELANIRTGRATPGMLDHLKVDVYGEKLPLKACGTVLVRDPQLLAISVFDPSTMDAVQKAIRESPLQLNPRAEGQEILVPIPRPIAETLQAMMKVCKSEAESAKVSVRHARKTAMDEVKKAGLSEDERHRVEKEVQKLTDDFISEVDRLYQEKEKSITLHSS